MITSSVVKETVVSGCPIVIKSIKRIQNRMTNQNLGENINLKKKHSKNRNTELQLKYTPTYIETELIEILRKLLKQAIVYFFNRCRCEVG